MMADGVYVSWCRMFQLPGHFVFSTISITKIFNFTINLRSEESLERIWPPQIIFRCGHFQEWTNPIRDLVQLKQNDCQSSKGQRC